MILLSKALCRYYSRINWQVDITEKVTSQSVVWLAQLERCTMKWGGGGRGQVEVVGSNLSQTTNQMFNSLGGHV